MTIKIEYDASFPHERDQLIKLINVNGEACYLSASQAFDLLGHLNGYKTCESTHLAGDVSCLTLDDTSCYGAISVSFVGKFFNNGFAVLAISSHISEDHANVIFLQDEVEAVRLAMMRVLNDYVYATGDTSQNAAVESYQQGISTNLYNLLFLEV